MSLQMATLVSLVFAAVFLTLLNDFISDRMRQDRDDEDLRKKEKEARKEARRQKKKKNKRDDRSSRRKKD